MNPSNFRKKIENYSLQETKNDDYKSIKQYL